MLVNTIKVTTVSGKQLPRNKCCYIDEQYYEREGEAVKIGQRWVVKSSPNIFFDNRTLSWRFKRNLTIINGIIRVAASGAPISGYFSSDLSTNIIVYILSKDGQPVQTTTYLNNDVVKLNPNIKFNSSLGFWEDIEAIKNTIIEGLNTKLSQTIGIGSYIYSFPQQYSAGPNLQLFQSYSRNLTINNPINMSNVSAFGDFSFGLEFESSKGQLSQNECFEYGLIPLKDGSIEGLEYTTIPMKGVEGFNLLINQLKLLQKKVKFNKECSLHLHLGGFPINQHNIWALYKLLLSIEPELMTMFPRWALITSRFKSSRKDYCTKLPIEHSFDSLYKYSSGGHLTFMGNLTNLHPNDREDRQKWNIHTRYHWVNLINLMFKENCKTCEFRVHGPTFNIQKVINWMFICSGILQYAIKHKDELIKSPIGSSPLSISTMLKDIYPVDVYTQLMSYIKLRQATFKLLAGKHNDCAGLLDLEMDLEQDFETSLITTVR